MNSKVIENIHFKIIIPMYNVQYWIGQNIKRIKSQKYKNFQCVIFDDMSTDKSVKEALKAIDGDERFHLVINKEKKYALQNIYEAILYSDPNDDDIIVTIDGDDWLANNKVLDIVKKYYDLEEILMTYGSYMRHPTGEKSTLCKYPDYVVEAGLYRQYEWLASHLRTFKYRLWKLCISTIETIQLMMIK